MGRREHILRYFFLNTSPTPFCDRLFQGLILVFPDERSEEKASADGSFLTAEALDDAEDGFCPVP